MPHAANIWTLTSDVLTGITGNRQHDETQEAPAQAPLAADLHREQKQHGCGELSCM
jgi:hypothetical protein